MMTTKYKPNFKSVLQSQIKQNSQVIADLYSDISKYKNHARMYYCMGNHLQCRKVKERILYLRKQLNRSESQQRVMKKTLAGFINHSVTDGVHIWKLYPLLHSN